MSHPRKLMSAVLIGLCLALPVRAAEFSAPQKSEIEGIVKDYLISHPEILRDMATELDRRQKAEEADQRHAMIAHAGKEIFDFDFQAVIGNPKGKVAWSSSSTTIAAIANGRSATSPTR